MKCPSCKAEEHTLAGIVRGKQRYRCRQCNYFFSVQIRSQRTDAAVKRRAIILYLEGFSSREVEQLTGVHHASLSKWVKEFGPKFPLMINTNATAAVKLDKPFVKLAVNKGEWMLVSGQHDTVLYIREENLSRPS